MRWDDLFADLEAQLALAVTRERAAEIDERVRIEFAGIRVRDRLRPAVGTVLSLRVLGGVHVSGELRRLGADWALVAEQKSRSCLVPLGAVMSIGGLGRWSAAPDSAGVVASRLRLRSVLRGVGRDRSAVRIHLADSALLDGTIDRVGADHVEVALHDVGVARRRGEVREVVAVPLAAIVAVRREDA